MTPHTFTYGGVEYRIEFESADDGWCGTVYEGHAKIGQAGSIPNKLRLPDPVIRSSITAGARFMLADLQQKRRPNKSG